MRLLPSSTSGQRRPNIPITTLHGQKLRNVPSGKDTLTGVHESSGRSELVVTYHGSCAYFYSCMTPMTLGFSNSFNTEHFRGCRWLLSSNQNIPLTGTPNYQIRASFNPPDSPTAHWTSLPIFWPLYSTYQDVLVGPHGVPYTDGSVVLFFTTPSPGPAQVQSQGDLEPQKHTEILASHCT